jgi:hypothetical protein
VTIAFIHPGIGAFVSAGADRLGCSTSISSCITRRTASRIKFTPSPAHPLCEGVIANGADTISWLALNGTEVDVQLDKDFKDVGSEADTADSDQDEAD